MARMQIRMSDEKFKHIQELMQEIGIENQKELINEALTLYEWAVNQKKIGRIITSMNEKEKTFKEVETPILSKVKPKKK